MTNIILDQGSLLRMAYRCFMSTEIYNTNLFGVPADSIIPPGCAVQANTDTMQNRYTGDIGDFVKLGILRALSPGHRLGVAWWLYPDEGHNDDGRHIGYLSQPEKWRHFDPTLFDALSEIVASGQRTVRAVETATILPGATFASETIPVGGTIAERPQMRRQWFETVLRTLDAADLVFADPDNGLEPSGHSLGSAKAGKSILLAELRALAKPGRCLIVYHHQTRRQGGHHSEIEYWADRLRESGFSTVDALRARPFSPRVFFLLDAPADVRQRAMQIEVDWQGWITWHPDKAAGSGAPPVPATGPQPAPIAADIVPARPSTPTEQRVLLSSEPKKSAHRRGANTTEVGYINRNGQEVVRPTGKAGTDHGQYVYVLRCRTCRHKYGANGSDIFQRRCPNHDGGAPGIEF